jgi:hypothetical protein
VHDATDPAGPNDCATRSRIHRFAASFSALLCQQKYTSSGGVLIGTAERLFLQAQGR